MIDRSEMFVMLNIVDQVLNHCDDIADAIACGHITTIERGDEIVGLAITNAGRRLMQPVLPTASA
jgi:hypothetical protein